MIQSMTGYGKSSCEINGKTLNVEIKSLNSKQLDISLRIVSMFRDKESDIRSLLLPAIQRGKVEVQIYFDAASKANTPQLNLPALENYKSQILQAAKSMNVPEPLDLWPILLKLPDAFTSEPETAGEETWLLAKDAMLAALDQFIQFRSQEGAMLADVFENKLHRIETLLTEIERFEGSRIEYIRNRIEEGLNKLKNSEYDPGRLEQEMIYYIEKLDINEEKTRLSNHCRYFRETMLEPAGQGKKLGFISQEIGREVNTLGSKSNQSDMQQLVVCMKDELEQIKEQVLNVL
ncbi:MAG: YicC family protein [Bacteroidales bacterium]|nr:YicC family protein [Bacteroidales bacterium]HKL92106.1 YicC/YloC family endoribonuclease [Bacteroidales bacterium]